LAKAWVNIDQGGTLKPPCDLRPSQIIHIEKKVGFACGVDVYPLGGNILKNGILPMRAERYSICKAKRFKRTSKRREELAQFLTRRVFGLHSLKPDHIAAKRAQTQGPIEIHPPMAAALWIAKSVS
jgi:hypothetical protein